MAEAASVVVRRRVQWFDTDSSTKYHNTAPLRFMEEAEAILLDRLGIVREVYGLLPRAHVSIDYRRPLRFWDEVDISLRVDAVGATSISYAFRISSGDEVCAEGRVVAVLITDGGAPRRWPEEYRRLLEGSGPLDAADVP
ncbi:MAG TPA: thioesterase family protein [Actinomycetota bacterium]|nr:thioesterase family protein [Actinomycetota bacterium]